MVPKSKLKVASRIIPKKCEIQSANQLKMSHELRYEPTFQISLPEMSGDLNPHLLVYKQIRNEMYILWRRTSRNQSAAAQDGKPLCISASI